MENTKFAISEFAEEAEAWKADHKKAMECRNLEDHLRLGIGVFYFTRVADEAWTKKVQAGKAKFDPARATYFQQEYRAWLKPCDHVLQAVEQTEREFEVSNAEHFRSCVRLARKLVGINLKQLIDSVGQAERGEVEPLTDEVWGGLQHRDHA